MKTLLLAGLMAVSALADEYVFEFTGSVTGLSQPTTTFTVGDTFTTQLFVNPNLIDSQPDDPLVGNFVHSLPATIGFSNDFTLNSISYDYVVVNDYYYESLGASYDAIAFYLRNDVDNIVFGIELRLPLNTFSSDLLQIPSTPIIPVGSNWFYQSAAQPGLLVSGSVDSMNVISIPENTTTALLVSGLAMLFISSTRRRRMTGTAVNCSRDAQHP